MKSYKEEIKQLASEITEIEILAAASNIDYCELVNGEIEDELLTPMVDENKKHAEYVMDKYGKKECEIGNDIYDAIRERL